MKYSVVVAEDEELLLHSLVNKIEKLNVNFEVLGKAQTGVQAYDLVKQFSPDLVITDIRMPEMDGISLLTKIRENYPVMDFIITSGYSDFEYARSAIHLQVTEYLLKPIDPEELEQVLITLKSKYEIQQSSFDDIFNSATARQSHYQIAAILKDYLIQNYNKDINLNLIANSMNYSSSNLTKIFCQYNNCSPSKFLINLRIQKAQNLLLHNPELSVREIGEIIGYDDQGYFSRIFKKQTGHSPVEFRC